MNEITQRGITALKEGDHLVARKLLSQAVSEHPEDVYAWLWLSGAVETDEQRIACLRRVLQIEPGNQVAARGLEKLIAKTPAPAPVPHNPPTEAEVAEQIDSSLGRTARSPHPQPFSQGEKGAPALPVPRPLPMSEGSSPAEQSDQAAPQETPDQPQPAQEPVPAQVFSRAKPAGHATPAEGATPQRIFLIRPSLVPALACFWLFFFIVVGIYNLLNEPSTTTFAIVGVLFLVFEFIVLFVIVRNFRTVYELTDQYLSLPFQGKKAKLLNSDVLHIEYRRSFWQKIRGTADILMDGVVDGELAHLRLRDIATYQKRIDQISSQAGNLE